LNNTTAEAY